MPYETRHPLVFFWVAFYRSGECLPQFDVQTGRENSFQDIDQIKLDKFGLFPFSPTLILKVNAAAGQIVAREAENLPFFIMKLEEGQRLINLRRNFIHMFSYQHCDKCGFDWQWMMGHKEGEIAEVGLPICSNHVVQKVQGKDKGFAQCPKCGVYNSEVCPDCGTLINEMARPITEEHYFLCPKCNKEHPRYIRNLEDTLRRLIYIMGYQTTIDNKNVKQLMYIQENGIITLKDVL
jgi:Zn finger protein HypA/HybF involved in hydrogenase expression